MSEFPCSKLRFFTSKDSVLPKKGHGVVCRGPVKVDK